MVVIGICDADTAVRIMLSNYIKRYKEETGISMQILAYDSGEKLIRHYPFEMDLIFLEVPLKRMNGLDLARYIREKDTKVSIVFLTTVLNHVLEAYEVRANNYLIKPLHYNRFLQEVEQARVRNGENRFFLEKNNNGIYKIYTKSICYIETEERNTLIHTETDAILSYKRMKEHEQVLFELYFVRCHTGFIINLLFFAKLEQNNIVLNNGACIPVSRQRRSLVLEQINRLYTEGSK